MTRIAVAVVAAYVVGAIPTSYWVVRAVKGVDLRTVGSGNLGATNAFRQLGWPLAIAIALFDMLKGVVPVVLLAPWAGLGAVGAMLLGMVAVAGHVFSVFVGFKGGKGVATGGGVILGLAPWAWLVALVTWALITKLTGFVSLGSIIAAAVLPTAVWLLHESVRPALPIIIALCAAIIWLHRANIRRLLDGTESRFGKKASAPAAGGLA
ncbi:MAG: glycerol-3-phosphate 1-O-acyltransferase PlsY [Aeromicrobium sp.]